MNAIFELAPDITDTQESRSAMIRDVQQFALSTKEDDDFLVVPPEENENDLFEESSTIIDIDNKKKEFNYLSSFNKDGTMISFGQDSLGLWWYFVRTGIGTGKNAKGPYRTKEKILTAMESINA